MAGTVGWVEFFTRPNIVQFAPKRWVSRKNARPNLQEESRAEGYAKSKNLDHTRARRVCPARRARSRQRARRLARPYHHHHRHLRARRLERPARPTARRRAGAGAR